MAAAILRAVGEYSTPEAKARCRAFAEGFRWPAFGERLRQLLAAPATAA
jgi:hypothetical protein